MPTPARRATAAIGASGAARKTSRAASRMRRSLRAAWARRPLRGAVVVIPSMVALEQIVPFCYDWNGTLCSPTAGAQRKEPPVDRPSRGEAQMATTTGAGPAGHSGAEIRPFRIDVSQADLDDRLARTRWANELPPEPTEGRVQTGP